jgi:hypothetical protein
VQPRGQAPGDAGPGRHSAPGHDNAHRGFEITQAAVIVRRTQRGGRAPTEEFHRAFLAVLTTVRSVRTVLWDHALATGVGAFVRVSHERVTSRSLYAPEGRISTAALDDLAVIDEQIQVRPIGFDLMYQANTARSAASNMTRSRPSAAAAGDHVGPPRLTLPRRLPRRSIHPLISYATEGLAVHAGAPPLAQQQA